MAGVDAIAPEYAFSAKYDILQEIRQHRPRRNESLNIAQFRKYVYMYTSHPSEEVEALLRDLERGFLLGFDPASPPHHLSQRPAHFFRSFREAAFILDTIIKEARAAILVPTKKRPLYFINFFAVPKRATDGTMSALRLIRNGSFAERGRFAVNEFIAEEHWKITNLPKLISYAELLIDMEFMALRDLKDAFRQLKLALSQYQYCGYSLFGQYWVDTRVAYGISSSANSCQRFVTLICEIFNKVAITPEFGAPDSLDIRECFDQILAYIDDFLMAAKDRAQCEEMERRFDALLESLNVKQSTSKAVATCQVAQCQGWEWDLGVRPKTIAIPPVKFVDYRQELLICLACRIVSVAVLKRVTGKMLHYSQIRREAKVLAWHGFQAASAFLRTRHCRDNDFVLLPPGLVRSWQLWYECSDYFRSNSIASLLYRPSLTVSADTDASDIAGGYFLGDHWGYYRFRPKMAKLPIHAKEAHVLLVMLHTLGERFHGRAIRVYCDNATVVGAVIRRWSSSPVLMCFIGELVMCLLRYRIYIHIEWISTHRNIFADALSRLQPDLFRRRCRLWRMTYRAKADSIVYPTRFRFPSVSRADDEAEYKRFCAWAVNPSPFRRKRWWCPSLEPVFRAIV